MIYINISLKFKKKKKIPVRNHNTDYNHKLPKICHSSPINIIGILEKNADARKIKEIKQTLILLVRFQQYRQVQCWNSHQHPLS